MTKMVYVDFALAGYKRDGTLPGNLQEFRDLMERLIDMVMDVKNEKFSISKNMLLAICIILEPGSETAKDAVQRLPEQLVGSSDFIGIVKELRAICEAQQCKVTMVDIQGEYADSCRRLAEAYESGVYRKSDQKLLLFRQQNQGVLPRDKENELENENQAAMKKCSEVFAFCKKYRITG